jgi:Flp pilus assembly protein TadD
MEFSEQNKFANQPGLADLGKQMPALARQASAKPDQAAGWANLGVALRSEGHLETAIALYRRALALEPDSAANLSNLGGALRAAGLLDEAIVRLRRATELTADFAAAIFNLGIALEDAGQLPEAVACYDRVLDLEPTRKDAAGQRAFALMRMGDFEKGLCAYEKRLEFEPMLKRGFRRPAWDGCPDNNKTLLLYSEQGRGDTFQFIRFAGEARSRVGRVIVECPRETAEVVKTAPGVDEVVIQGLRLPQFDCHASLMSLPYLFKTTLETIPGSVPYLSVPPSVLGSVSLVPTKQLKVGIAWASGHTDIGVHDRSVGLAKLLRFFELPQVALYSLQVGTAASQIKELGCTHLIQDLGEQFKDFGSTADAIRQLDLVISADTAIVHLAGALAKPVWVLLPYASEWRWLQSRIDSPWYPTVRLFRQQKPFGWDGVVEQVVQDLKALPGSSRLSNMHLVCSEK